jgi:hypothetical protein
MIRDLAPGIARERATVEMTREELLNESLGAAGSQRVAFLAGPRATP